MMKLVFGIFCSPGCGLQCCFAGVGIGHVWNLRGGWIGSVLVGRNSQSQSRAARDDSQITISSLDIRASISYAVQASDCVAGCGEGSRGGLGGLR